MKLKLSAFIPVATAGFMALSVMASDSFSPTTPTAPDKGKLSYAVGMRMGMQLIESGTNADTDVGIHAVEDVLEGKPTMIQPSEVVQILNHTRAAGETEQDKTKFSYAGGMRMALLFKRSGVDVDPKVVVQAMQDVVQGNPKMKQSEIGPIFIQAAKYEEAKKEGDNETEGTAFLAKNKQNPGIQVMPDGLQYQIIQEGTGPYAKPDDLIYVNYSGTFINGVEFDHHPHFLTRINGGIQGWRDVLPKMRVGAEWKIYAPPALAFGHNGESFHNVGPDETVIYDLQLVSIAPPGGNYEISSGLGHGLDIGASSPAPNSAQ